MNKKLYSLVLALLALTGMMSSCSDNEEIVFPHERQQFPTQADRVLLEFIAPFGTTVDEEIYIVGAFNGDSAAIGQPEFLLTKAPESDVKFGVYLNPVGTFANVWGQRWESYYWSGGEKPEPVHDGFVVYVDDQTGWDALTLYMWGDINNLNGDWPGMNPTGTWEKGGVKWTYFDMGAANTGLNENLIFNNGGNGTQLADFNFTIDRDIYLLVTADGVEEIGLEPTVQHGRCRSLRRLAGHGTHGHTDHQRPGVHLLRPW